MVRIAVVLALASLSLACGTEAPPITARDAPGLGAPHAFLGAIAQADDTGGLSPPAANGPIAAADALTLPSPEGNPFAGATFHLEKTYVAAVERSAKAYPLDAERLKKVAQYPTAVWISSLDDVPKVATTLDAAAREQKATAAPVVTVFAIYDLPDRDCAATASSGDLESANGGLERYKHEFIDKIAAAFKAHGLARIAAVIEPDSLANIATNMTLDKCKAAAQTYETAIAYAIKTLALPNVSLYVDAAHAGWLGWSKNRKEFVRVVAEVLAEAGGAAKIRGFATNISNYDALTHGDLATLEPSDPATGELAYVQLLAGSLGEAGITGKAFVIDTGRNGRKGLRTKSGSWCNVRGAGLGERPRANPAPLVDAYLWVKPPGESDGGADPKKAGYDPKCGGPDAADSAPGAPSAGAWFAPYFVDLATNANPPL